MKTSKNVFYYSQQGTLKDIWVPKSLRNQIKVCKNCNMYVPRDGNDLCDNCIN